MFLNPSLVLLLEITFAVLVAAYFAWMFGNQQLNLLVLMLTFFVAISFGAFAGDTLLKYVRVFTTVAMILAGFVFYKLPKRGPAIRAFLPFLVVYVAAAMYSDFRLYGLIYKSFFACTFLAGAITAYTIQTREELVQALRFLIVIAAIGAIQAFRSDSFQALGETQRFAAFGLNPIFVGASVATLLPFAGCLILCERTIFWRLIPGLVFIALSIILLLTGSRSPALQAVVGIFIMGLSVVRSRQQRILAVLLLLVTVGIGYGLFRQNERIQRIFSLTDTRSSEFIPRWEKLLASPWFGFGWDPKVVDGVPYQDNAHSAYLQIAMDTGFIGLIFFVIIFLRIIYLAAQVYRRTRFQRGFSVIAILPLAVIFGLAMISFLETPMIQGTEMSSMMFGFAIGLIDRLPTIASYSQVRHRLQYRVYANEYVNT